jgi:hypothetical protein
VIFASVRHELMRQYGRQITGSRRMTGARPCCARGTPGGGAVAWRQGVIRAAGAMAFVSSPCTQDEPMNPKALFGGPQADSAEPRRCRSKP